MTSGIDHRFNGKNHPYFELRPTAFWTEIGDLRLFVKGLTYTVTNELPYHAKSEAFNIILDSVSNVKNPISFAALRDSALQTLFRDF